MAHRSSTLLAIVCFSASGCQAGAENAAQTSGTTGLQVSGESEAPGSSDVGLGSTSTSADESGSSDGTESSGETGSELPACTHPDGGRVARLIDPECGSGGTRCQAAATCVLQAEAPSRTSDGAWDYTLACEGEWTGEYIDKREPVTSGTVRLTSRVRLDLGDAPMAYEYEEDYEDRFDGSEAANGSLVRGKLPLVGAGYSTGSGFAGFVISSDDDAVCDGNTTPNMHFSEPCRIPQGINGTDNNGDAVRADGSEPVWMRKDSGDFLVDAWGLAPCEPPSGSHTYMSQYAVLHGSVVVR